MKKILDRLSVVAVIGIICAAIIVVSLYYNGLFERTSAKWRDRAEALQSDVNGLEYRIKELEKRPRLTVETCMGRLHTSDYAPGRDSSQTGPFECREGKGLNLVPSIEIAFGSTNVHEYTIQCEKAVGAWFLPSEPYSQLTNFEHIRVYRPWNSNGVFNIIVQLKPNASVNMRFDVMVLKEL